MEDQKNKRGRELSPEEHLRIIEVLAANEKTHREIAKEFGCSRSLVSKLNTKDMQDKVRRSVELEKNSPVKKKIHSNGYFPELESSLVLWMHDMEGRGIPVTENLIMTKAARIVEQMVKMIQASNSKLAARLKKFRASRGWLARFLTRHKFKHLKVCGEGRTASGGRKRKRVLILEIS
jgi:hypothetical protein